MPVGSIILTNIFTTEPFPLGWAPCDGNKYLPNSNPSFEYGNYNEDSTGFQTPNLRMRAPGYAVYIIKII